MRNNPLEVLPQTLELGLNCWGNKRLLFPVQELLRHLAGHASCDNWVRQNGEQPRSCRSQSIGDFYALIQLF